MRSTFLDWRWPLVFIMATGCLASSPTGETWFALRGQCVETGGEWVRVAECPRACWPPAPDETGCVSQMDCVAMCGSEPSCHCPADLPFWEEGEGCVGFDRCPE
jgi:hypothetical protein